jgi:hypothetical protein
MHQSQRATENPQRSLEAVWQGGGLLNYHVLEKGWTLLLED